QVLHQRLSQGGFQAVHFIRDCHRRRHDGILATVISAQSRTGLRTGEQISWDPVKGSSHHFGSAELDEYVVADSLLGLKEGRSLTRSYELSSGTVEVFLEVVRPPIQVAIFGSGFDVIPLVQTAHSLGWAVTCVANRTPTDLIADQI